jgi:hypothetical protein
MEIRGEVLLLVNVDLSQSASNSASSNIAPPSTVDSQGNLILKVTAPVDGATLNANTVNVTGETAPGASVSVNEQTYNS